MNKILQEVLERVKPDKKEETRITELAQELLYEAQKNGSDYTALIVGSVAKGTFLKDADIDLFLKFSEGINLKKEGLAIARRILPDGRELYAQHPYLSGEKHGIGLDVVPCYEVKDPSKPVSAVDRTPFHTEWVKENINGMEDEVRLAKQFLKGIGAYGAGSSIGGFSGYLVEILTIKYKGFKNLITQISKWRPNVNLGIVECAPEASLMLPDPVDSKRNVAAGVTVKGLGTAILASKAFLQNPTTSFFFPNKTERKNKGNITTIILPHPGGSEESALSWLQKQGRKVFRAISEFEPITWNANLNSKGFITIETARIELPNLVPHEGPAPWETGALNFLKKYPDATLLSGKLEVGKKPRYSKIESLILEILPEAKIKSEIGDGAKIIQRLPWLN